MRWINEAAVAASLNFPALFATLQAHFAGSFQQPARQLLALAPEQSERHDALALLPVWNDDFIGCKLFSYFPDNPAQGKPRLYSRLMLFSARDGEPLALLEGALLTHWRTAAVSALAARFLANPAARTLLLCGTGQLAPFFARAYASALPLRDINIWGRDLAKAQALVDDLKTEPLFAGIALKAVALDETTVAGADVISCLSAATAPLFPASWVRPGTFVDAVGNHRADVSEIDPQLVIAGELYVDTRANCLREAGEILLPLKAGVISAQHIKGELADLCKMAAAQQQVRSTGPSGNPALNAKQPAETALPAQGFMPVSASQPADTSPSACAVPPALPAVLSLYKADKVMIFKAVGCALADLAAATLVYRHAMATGKGQHLA